MTLLTEATDVFAAAENSGRCVVAFPCKRQPVPPGAFGAREREEIATVLRSLQAEDWRLSVRAMFDPESSVEPTAFDSGFACAIDFAGMSHGLAPIVCSGGGLRGSVYRRPDWVRE